MCSRVQCPKCGRPTFAGCGMHVEQVLGGVPKEERCHCREKSTKTAEAPTPSKPGWLDSLFGRGS